MKPILKPEVQEFINENLKTDIAALVLKGSPFPEVSAKDLAEQIQSKRKAEKKLPTWFSRKNILYPPSLNLSQTSSEIAAEYKSKLLSGKLLIDITGGFGVDDFYFSQRMEEVVHCEINPELSELAAHNFKEFSIQNIQFYKGNGLDFLKNLDQKADWIYADPGRRDSSKKKVFKLEDSEPNLLNNLDLLIDNSKNILLKTSPLLDLKRSINQLENTFEVHVLAVRNEVKEILFLIKPNSVKPVEIKTINFTLAGNEEYSGFLEKEETAKVNFSEPLQYLYEPNAAILKAGFFKSISSDFKVYKLAKNSHLYTSKEKIDFPGRVFRITEVLSPQKKQIKKAGIKKTNISSRNFGMGSAELKKKFSLKDGGSEYLFFTEDLAKKKILIRCEKA